MVRQWRKKQTNKTSKKYGRKRKKNKLKDSSLHTLSCFRVYLGAGVRVMGISLSKDKAHSPEASPGACNFHCEFWHEICLSPCPCSLHCRIRVEATGFGGTDGGANIPTGWVCWETVKIWSRPLDQESKTVWNGVILRGKKKCYFKKLLFYLLVL